MANILMRPVLALALAALLPAAAGAQQEDAGAYLAARVAAAGSDYRSAADWFTRALAADPSNTSLIEGALISDFSLGEIEKAVPLATRLTESGNGAQAAALVLLADRAKREEYQAILTAEPTGLGPLVDRLSFAWAAFGAGRMSEALEAFDQLATTQGLEPFGLYHKALALAAAGDFEGADEILSGRDGNALRVMRRGSIAHAQILSQLDRNADAVAMLEKSFGTDADAGIDALKERLAAGETLPYDVARNATDGMAEIFFTLAGALSGEVDDGSTLLYARTATHLRPDHTEALLLSAQILDNQGQHQLASETYARIPTADPMFFVAEIGRADALRADGKIEASLEVLQGLARSKPELMQVHLALGDALRREERYADAVKAYDAAIARVPAPERQHWPLFYSRGICHERLSHWKEAEADFRRALELNPDEPQVLNYLGYSFVDRGQNLEEALSMIERAVAARPESGYIIDSLAWAYFRLGRYQDAVEPMEKASLLEPVDPIVTDHLGDVYWAVGRKLEARFQWHRALSFDPEEKEAQRIRRKLEVGLDALLAEEGAKPLSVAVRAND
ncbi:tetratricopeptide repeat protein [Cereibacter sphaeroides]|uniref:Tetratricopeptide repeat protein n=1 Tax=Cereibacter sphaeroides TaxID=1063 RepID=A0AAX1UPP9_CERSP|nr:tetratricopeptide repeat protein [Cereibacter sphaeroides]ACL99940.1 TPR repeat-containing protein precursor [Cereibacter sphaeroides KD131]AZB56400.1 tetratricopeptide repeat protein [Cereibacter sphaeroides]AZB60661.1 tetratricopeptide repeat protein [Cereibacter sphaeroides]EGJ23232.1 TPR repeat-containing protein precursor [Cereibacter sphaeroides WS8N]RHZ97503.1 tetratricopeptide repeat protein [Cereibacter sphaeroides]